MLRSLYAGVSGLKGHQQKMDVIGNNIANVNTFGYKKGRYTFQSLMSQTINRAEGPTDNGTRGGKNPVQVGLGSTTGSIDTITTQGSQQTTNRPLDLMISGSGYFVVGDPANFPDASFFTRAGNFYLDRGEDGADFARIVNANGQFLLDIDGQPIEIPTDAQSFSIASNGDVNYIDANGELVQNPQRIGLAKFSNPGGLEKVGGNLFRASDNSGEPFGNACAPFTPGEDGTGELVSGALEMSNVDLSEEFTEMIVTQRGFQANTRIITTSDEILQELVNLKR